MRQMLPLPTHFTRACPVHDVVCDDLLDGQVVGRCRLSTTPELAMVRLAVAQVMNQLQLESLQAEKPSVCRQRAVRGDPQDVGVDQADVEDTPKAVSPPTPTCTPHSVVGPQLIKLVDATHVLVVASYTHWHRQDSWRLRRVCRTKSSPALLVAMRNTLRLSRHLTSITPSSFRHLADPLCRSRTSPSELGNSRRVARVVPQRYVLACSRSAAKWTDVKKLSA